MDWSVNGMVRERGLLTLNGLVREWNGMVRGYSLTLVREWNGL